MADKFRKLTDNFWVSPQLTADDVADAAAMGVKLIINNRPDGEAPGQPQNAEIEAAAKTAGIAYGHLPVDGRGVAPQHAAALMRALISVGDGAVLAFCGSGMRSVLVLAYAAARLGKPASRIVAEAAAAGYDISAHEQALTMFKAPVKPSAKPPA